MDLSWKSQTVLDFDPYYAPKKKQRGFAIGPVLPTSQQGPTPKRVAPNQGVPTSSSSLTFAFRVSGVSQKSGTAGLHKVSGCLWPVARPC